MQFTTATSGMGGGRAGGATPQRAKAAEGQGTARMWDRQKREGRNVINIPQSTNRIEGHQRAVSLSLAQQTCKRHLVTDATKRNPQPPAPDN